MKKFSNYASSFLIVHVLLIGVLFCGSASADTPKKIYKLAVVPQFTATQLFHNWTPVLKQLESLTGLEFKLLVYNDFPQFENDFANGVPDLVFLNPYHMVIAKKKQGYRPLLRDANNLSGILVSKVGSTINSPKDLSNKTIAFPSPNALGASLYIRALLSEKLHINFKPVYVNGHQNVYRHVILDEAEAGGGVIRTLEKEPEAIKSQLRIIFNTPEIASHPLAAHPRVKTEDSDKIVEAFVAMQQDDEHKKMLNEILIPMPIKADYKRDYAVLEKLKLEKFVKQQEN